MTFTDHRMGGGSRRPHFRILLVEDSDTVRLLTAEYLRSCGHTVSDVDSAENALEMLDTARFDVLFTDVSLPGMSGHDLARRTCSLYPGIALIISSGFDEPPDLDGLATPAQFLAKPYDLFALDKAFAAVAQRTTSAEP